MNKRCNFSIGSSFEIINRVKKFHQNSSMSFILIEEEDEICKLMVFQFFLSEC